LTLSADTSAQNYTEAFYRYEWALESVTATQISFGILPVEAIRKSVFSENMTLNIINTFKRNGTQQLFQIQAAITRGIAIGQGYQKTASGMKDAYNKGLSDALRVVRTESGRCYSEGYLKAHDDAAALGVQTRKRWIATLDNRTRDTHGALDGEYADKDGYFHSDGAKALAPHLFGVAAQDINCRCDAVDEIEGLEPKFRRLKGFGLQPYQTFADWAEPQGWTRAKGWPRVKMM
jgi:SPP1 gp7 family putative phage head morphogenesis protein